MIERNQANPDIQNAFRALADPTRREILMLLSQHNMTIADVTNRFDITRAAIKKHLVILAEGNLISITKQGRERINSFNAQGLKQASDWLSYFDSFWDTRLDALKTAIETGEREKND